MQVRTSSASGASAKSDRLAFVHLVPFFDGKFRQMQIERQQALAMVDHHTIPFKEQRPRQNNATTVDGGDRRSTGHAEIEPLMRALHGTVENALNSEHVGDRGIHRRRERSLPFAPGTERFESVFFCFLVLFDLALVFWAGRGIAPGNLQLNARIALASDTNFLFERDGCSGRLPGGASSKGFAVQLDGIGSRLGFKAVSRKREP